MLPESDGKSKSIMTFTNQNILPHYNYDAQSKVEHNFYWDVKLPNSVITNKRHWNL